MENLTGTNKFWEVGTIYRHMGYPNRKWKMVGEEDEFVKLESLDGEKPYYLLTGRTVRPICIYKYPFQ
jgi:hypothetical protein